MALQSAFKVRLHIGKDRTVHLPDDFPEGDAEVIVLYDVPPFADDRTRKAALRRDAFGAEAARA